MKDFSRSQLNSGEYLDNDARYTAIQKRVVGRLVEKVPNTTQGTIASTVKVWRDLQRDSVRNSLLSLQSAKEF